jgi:periplasmic protein TonB
VRSPFRLPLAASIVAHGCAIMLLIMLAARLPALSPPVPVATSGIEIILAPPEPPPPVAEIPPPPEPPPPEPPPPPEAQPPPPEPPPPVVETEAPPPPPPPKPAAKPPPPRRPPPQPARAQAPQQTAMAPPQAAPLAPAPTPAGPVVSANYRLALSAWLENHKHYPDGARERSEEGRAVLRFRVDRLGRVLDYALLQSTGHPDLDASIDQMMRGASMPPFPPDMAASEVEVSVTIRFALAR